MLELEVLQEQLGIKKGGLITQDTVDEINNLVEDPDYGEQFLDAYVSYFNILEKNGAWSTPKYMNALKFFTLVEAGHSNVDAYIKTFPERLASRMERGQDKSHMGGEASRYNASALVNEIRKVATIPVQLIHRHLMHEAIIKTAGIMNDPRASHAVQQKAAETLIRELKPVEDSTIELKIGADDETKNMQRELVDQVAALAAAQRAQHAAGLDITEIQKLNIKKPDVVDAEIEDE